MHPVEKVSFAAIAVDMENRSLNCCKHQVFGLDSPATKPLSLGQELRAIGLQQKISAVFAAPSDFSDNVLTWLHLSNNDSPL